MDSSRLNFGESWARFNDYKVASFMVVGTGILLGFTDNLWWVTAGLGLVALAILVSYKGVLINTQTRSFKTYLSFLGIKWGRWNAMDHYPDMVVLRRKKAYGGPTEHTGTDLTTSEIFYEVQLASMNHLRRVTLYQESAKNRDMVYEKARSIAEQAGIELVKFNPGMKMPRQLL
ncbi:MAG: hypothetical protein AAFR61_25185 [Bacteroidota bacterium]